MQYPVTTGDIMHVMGSFAVGMDYTVRLKLKLIDPIDADILCRAVEKTQKRYPYLCVHLKKNEDRYYYEENPAPIKVLHTDERVSLNTQETDYHVWAVCYSGDRLYLDIYHGIADGTGMYMVLATLLYYYCAERYGVSDHTGIRILDDPILPEETLDPYDRLPQIDLSQMRAPERKPVFNLLADGRLTPGEDRIFDVEIPEAAFVQFSSANDASPGTMVSILLARAVDAVFPEHEKTIVNRYVVNARPMLHGEQSHHNCVGSIEFPYTDRVKAMPFDWQCTAHRGTTFIQSDADRIRGMMTGMASRNRMILSGLPSLEAKKQAFGQMIGSGRTTSTFIVSYVGQWKLKSLSPYISEFWTHVPTANPLLAEIAAINGKIFLSIHQMFQEDCVIQSFLKELSDNAIPYEIKGPISTDIPRFPEPTLE